MADIPHMYSLRMYPAKTKCWPWEMTLTEVAQEILFEAFKACGGIDRGLCKYAVKERNCDFLKAQVLRILVKAETERKEMGSKMSKRLKGLGMVVPLEWDKCPKAIRNIKTVSDVNTKGMAHFLDLAGELLLEVHQSMIEFPYLPFLDSFPGADDDVRVGFGWNSICLFFAAGLRRDVYFPFLEDVGIFDETTLFDTILKDFEDRRLNYKPLVKRSRGRPRKREVIPPEAQGQQVGLS